MQIPWDISEEEYLLNVEDTYNTLAQGGGMNISAAVYTLFIYK